MSEGDRAVAESDAGPAESLYGHFDLSADVAERLFEAREMTERARRSLLDGIGTPTVPTPVADDATTESPPDTSLLMRLLEETGDLAGKYDPPVSLGVHSINAVVTGVTAYAVDEVLAGREPSGDVVKLLTGALALHDCNKFVEQRHPEAFADWLTDNDRADDVDADLAAIRDGEARLDNTEALLDFYFDLGDPLGVRFVLPSESGDELRADLNDVKWLIQRTETKEDAAETTGRATRRVRDGIVKYARIGDGFVSALGDSQSAVEAAEWLRTFYRDTPSDPATASLDTTDPVQVVRLTPLEQPVLHDQVLATTKAVIEGHAADSTTPDRRHAHGVVLGSTPDAIVYLGEPVDRTALTRAVEAQLMDRITDQFDFGCKTEWNSFEPDILEEVSIPIDEKRAQIRDGYVETLLAGSGLPDSLEDGFEEGAIPDGYAEHLPELAFVLFGEGPEARTAFEGYPALLDALDAVEENDEYNAFTRKMGIMAELLFRYRGGAAAGQYRTDADSGATAAEVRSQLDDALDPVGDAFADSLTPEADAGALVVGRAFGDERRGSGDLAETVPASNDETCFLCGRSATRQYKKGNEAFYGTNAFSKRVGAEQAYKRICPVCNLEHALLRSEVMAADYTPDADITVGIVYYDAFVAGIGLDSGTSGELIRRLYRPSDDETGDDASRTVYDVADPAITAESFGAQYHLLPLYIPDENRRLAAVSKLTDVLVSRGLKVHLAKPFAAFRPTGTLFTDATPSRRQVAFGADQIDSYEALERVRTLLTLLWQCGTGSDSDEYLAVADGGVEEVARLVVESTDHYEHSIRDDAHQYFTQIDGSDTYMMMREVARAGIDLYGVQYSDKSYKKVKLFRRALDATVEGMARGKTDDSLLEYVAGQAYAEAQEEEYTGKVTPEQAEAFVEATFDYLRSEGSFELDDIDDRRNTLVKVYEFAYDQLVREHREATADDDTTSSSEATADGASDD